MEDPSINEIAGWINRLGNAHYRFLSLWPGYVRLDAYGAALIGNRLVPIPFRNHATFVRAQPGETSDLIETAHQFFQELGAIPAFQLDPETQPADFGERLLRAGFQKQVEEAWMVCDLRPIQAAAPASDLHILQLDEASDERVIQAYIDCYNISFRAPTHAIAGFGESFRGVLSHPAAIHYLGLLDGEPAGSMSLFFEGELGCVYNVGAFPAYRGRGVATAMLRHLAADAARLGVALLFLQAVHHGPAQPVYERVGFRTLFLRQWYLPQPPGGIWS
jgi:ribosomal protein S18 acetylase RimI-like enzyme